MSQPSILYVEDEEDYQILVRRILGRAGWRVETADTGAEGLAALAKERPSLLLLDINLPDTDGYAICRQLRQDPAFQDLPILMLTVRRRPEEWLRGFSAGANDYLSKPFDPKGLVERVENGLSGQTLRLASAGTPEFQLIQAAAGGNRAAFEILIQKYRDRLIEAIRPTARAGVDVEDVVANAFLIAFESLKDFRGEAAFYTWLYRIAANENLLVQRKTNELSIEELTKGDEAVLPRALAQEDATDHRLAHHEERDRLLQILEEVPELYREILSMYFVREMSYEAISETLQIPLGTVMSRLFKARTLLKKSWGREDRAEARRALLS